MKKKKNKPSIPTHFEHEGQTWTINYHDERPDQELGTTRHDLTEINLWIRGLPLVAIKETLQHEILHIILRDLVLILSHGNMSDFDKEESLIRLLSPRLFGIYRDNPALKEFIYGK